MVLNLAFLTYFDSEFQDVVQSASGVMLKE
jgi:hypothetical protein